MLLVCREYSAEVKRLDGKWYVDEFVSDDGKDRFKWMTRKYTLLSNLLRAAERKGCEVAPDSIGVEDEISELQRKLIEDYNRRNELFNRD